MLACAGMRRSSDKKPNDNTTKDTIDAVSSIAKRFDDRSFCDQIEKAVNIANSFNKSPVREAVDKIISTEDKNIAKTNYQVDIDIEELTNTYKNAIKGINGIGDFRRLAW